MDQPTPAQCQPMSTSESSLWRSPSDPFRYRISLARPEHLHLTSPLDRQGPARLGVKRIAVPLSAMAVTSPFWFVVGVELASQGAELGERILRGGKMVLGIHGRRTAVLCPRPVHETFVSNPSISNTTTIHDGVCFDWSSVRRPTRQKGGLITLDPSQSWDTTGSLFHGPSLLSRLTADVNAIPPDSDRFSNQIKLNAVSSLPGGSARPRGLLHEPPETS